MTDQLQNAFATLINKVVVDSEAAGTFIVSELPDVIRQLLIYKMIISTIATAIGMSIILIALYIICTGIRSKWRSTGLIITSVISGAFGTFLGIPLIISNIDWLMIWLAPKVYLIEYASKLVKQ